MALDTWDVLKYTSNVSKKLILWESWGQLDCRGWTEAGASVFAAFEVNSKGDIFMFLGGGSTIGSFRNSMRYEPIEQSPVWYMYHWRYALDWMCQTFKKIQPVSLEGIVKGTCSVTTLNKNKSKNKHETIQKRNTLQTIQINDTGIIIPKSNLSPPLVLIQSIAPLFTATRSNENATSTSILNAMRHVLTLVKAMRVVLVWWIHRGVSLTKWLHQLQREDCGQQHLLPWLLNFGRKSGRIVQSRINDQNQVPAK